MPYYNRDPKRDHNFDNSPYGNLTKQLNSNIEAPNVVVLTVGTPPLHPPPPKKKTHVSNVWKPHMKSGTIRGSALQVLQKLYKYHTRKAAKASANSTQCPEFVRGCVEESSNNQSRPCWICGRPNFHVACPHRVPRAERSPHHHCHGSHRHHHH